MRSKSCGAMQGMGQWQEIGGLREVKLKHRVIRSILSGVQSCDYKHACVFRIFVALGEWPIHHGRLIPLALTHISVTDLDLQRQLHWSI